MAATRLADIIKPDVWLNWIIERTAEVSALFQSGIVANVPELGAFGTKGGNTLNIPFWQDLTGNSEVLSATGGALTVNPIESAQDIGVVLARGKGWGVNELAAQLTGDDPGGAIANLIGDWWARDMQDTLINILTGIFDSMGDESTPVNIHDISANSGSTGIISADAIMDAQQLLGDSKGKLTAIGMHSAVENYLAKQEVIDYVQPSDVGPRVPMYADKRVVVDDSHPANAVSGVSGTVYDTYLFGPGAIAFADQTAESKVTAIEDYRAASQGEDHLFSRRHFILHPRGVAWTGSSTAAGGPANTALATGTNWTRRYTAKNIRIVLLRHRIA